MTDAEQHAYLITGAREGHFRGPAIGVAFFPDPPDRKIIAMMGFGNPVTTERVRVDTATSVPVPKEPTLFFFPRGPTPTSTYVAKLEPDGRIASVKEEPLAPGHVIPRLCGSSAARYMPKLTGPDATDVQKLGRPGGQERSTSSPALRR